MRFRSPRLDDAPFVVVFIRVNHRNFQAVHQANRIDSNFAVVETVINFFNRRPIENPPRILESDPMQDEIAAVFLSVPTVAQTLYLHNVNICRFLARAAPALILGPQHRAETILFFNNSAVTDDHPLPLRGHRRPCKPLFIR